MQKNSPENSLPYPRTRKNKNISLTYDINDYCVYFQVKTGPTVQIESFTKLDGFCLEVVNKHGQ